MKNKEKQNLEDFNLTQLNVLLKHLRLGADHLRLILTQKQMSELLNWCTLSEKQKDQLSATRIEKLGNMSLIINTILTSTFGAWMGLSGCIGCNLGSFKMLFIISVVAFFVSGMIGYLSLRMTKVQAQEAYINQRIHDFQLKVLKIINQKNEEKNEEVAFYLNTAVYILENKNHDKNFDRNNLNLFKNTKEAYQWIEHLEEVLENHLNSMSDASSRELYQKQINQSLYQIKRTLSKHVNFLEMLATTEKKEKKHLQIRPTLLFLKVLTNPSFGVPKHRSLNSSSWVKGNFSQLLLGMVPTMWGSFASMFVFVGGIPNIARELNFVWLATFLTQPFARVCEISLAIFITCYFTFAFLYSSRKGWQREQMLEDTEKLIDNEDTLMLVNTHKLTMLHKVKNQTQKLISTLTVLKHKEHTDAKERGGKAEIIAL